MRTLLGGEFAVATAGDTMVDLYGKLEVQNGSGTWIDVATAYGKPPIINATGGEAIDQPISQATFTIVQAIGAKSGAPLMSASVLNRLDDGVTYSPLFDIGRLVRFNVATMPIGVALDVSKYREVFIGRINLVSIGDSIDWLGPVTLTCSDLGNVLMRRQIKVDGRQYGSALPGTALLTVLQSISDDNLPGGEPAVTIVKSSTSNFGVATGYTQGAVKVFQALADLVLNTTGEDFRYRYDAAHVSQPMWFNPDRTRVTVDQTFAKDGYILQKLDLSLDNIRNSGRMPWSDPVLATSGFNTSISAPSIAKYLESFFSLPASPLLFTQAQSQTVLDTVVNDLSVPPGEAIAIMPFLWFVQLYDRYTFPANGRQYDQDQTFAVIGYQWSIQNRIGSTALTLAAHIIGAYAAWQKKIGGIVVGGAAGPPIAKLNLVTQNTRKITVQLDAAYNPAQAPIQWQYRIVGQSNYNPAFSAVVIGGLPAQVSFIRSELEQGSIELKVTQADGQTDTKTFNVQGVITDLVDSHTGRVTEDDARSGKGGVPVYRGRIVIDDQYDATGGTLMFDALLGRHTSSSKGPTGIAMDTIEDGGNKGHTGFTSTTGDIVSTGKDSRARLLTTGFQYGVDGPPGVVESGIQAFVHPSYTDASRRPITLRDASVDVVAADINTGQARARGGFTGTTGQLVTTSVDSRARLLNTGFQYAVDGPAGVVESGTQAFVHPSYTDASRRPMTLRDQTLGVDVTTNNIGRNSARQGAYAKGTTGEDRSRMGEGGVPVPGASFSGVPLVDVTGVNTLIDTTAMQIVSALAIGPNVRGDSSVVFGGSTKYPTSRHNEDVSGIHGATVNFSHDFDQVPPNIRAMPMTWTLPGSNSTVDRKMELKPINVLVNQADIRAVYSTGATTTAESELFATTQGGADVAEETGVPISAPGAAAYCRLDEANGVLTTYKVYYDVNTASMSGALMHVKVYKNASVGGTVWTQVASANYDVGLTLTDEVLQFDAVMTLNWDVQVVVSYSVTPAVNGTVTCEKVTYDQVVAGSEISLAPAGSIVLVQATETS